eukprot:gb/GECG01015661.1/.p1 GENE.gb/GECG01015661.1/~~gb/GECG01015661.1/.p1  ORF type:complete len:220 (+),score=36.98 gb/GECG01015661.1/:1-660(+)
MASAGQPAGSSSNIELLPDKLTIYTTYDNKETVLPRKVYTLSGYLREQAEIGGKDNEEPVEVHGVPKETLNKVIHFMEKHQEHPIPLHEIEHHDTSAYESAQQQQQQQQGSGSTGGGNDGRNSHRTIPKPLKDAHLENNGFPRWSAKFAEELGLKETFEIMRIAHELAIHPLTMLLAAKVASCIKDMSQEEYKKLFSEGHSFSPEEEASVSSVSGKLYV